MYKGQVIQFFGGVHVYLGEIDQAPHKMGEGWWRILNPCLIFTEKDPVNNRINTVVAALRGPTKAYKQYVDIYMPPSEPIEIRTLDKNGDMYKIYKQESERKDPELIVTPSNADIHRLSMVPKVH